MTIVGKRGEGRGCDKWRVEKKCTTKIVYVLGYIAIQAEVCNPLYIIVTAVVVAP